MHQISDTNKAPTQNTLKELLFYDKGAMSFRQDEIPSEVVAEMLNAATSCTWLGKWRIIAVNTKENILRVVESWQNGLRRIGRNREVEFIERWKEAPLIVVFCHPKVFDRFQFVPGTLVRAFSIYEVGTAVRSIELVALTHGVGLHGIMGVLVPEVGQPIKDTLGIPEDYEIVYLGVMGYPGEVVAQRFPSLNEVCYAEKWETAY